MRVDMEEMGLIDCREEQWPDVIKEGSRERVGNVSIR